MRRAERNRLYWRDLDRLYRKKKGNGRYKRWLLKHRRKDFKPGAAFERYLDERCPTPEDKEQFRKRVAGLEKLVAFARTIGIGLKISD